MTTASDIVEPAGDGGRTASVSDERYLPIAILAARWLAWVLALAFLASGLNEEATGSEGLFLLVALVQNAAATVLATRPDLLPRRRFDTLLVVSVVDMTLAMLAVYFTGGINSPFYLFAVSTLLTPASALGFAGMLMVAGLFVGGYVLALSTTDGDLHSPQSDAGPRSLAVFVAVPFALALLAQLLGANSRRLESALAENRRLQPLREQLAIQQERDRIARELHDGLSQSVYMLSLNLEAAAEAARNDPGIRSRLETLVALARHIVLEVRQHIFDLRPLLEGEAGISDVLRNQAGEFSAVSGLPVDVRITGDEGQLPLAQRAAIYRISQEALSNVYRHAGASRASLQVMFGSDEVVVEIIDDGTGVSGEAGSGMGLRNIRERAEGLDGKAEIGRAPGGGTAVRAVLPRNRR
jgi:signal transduction histidine kinase